MPHISNVIVLTAFLTGIGAGSASAQTLTTLVGLGSPTSGSLIQASDGGLYGVTLDGIYRVSLSGMVTIPAVMNNLQPNQLVQASDGNFYGTTFSGGPVGLGLVFRMTPSGTVTTLYRFGTVTTDGNNPRAGLIQASDGSLYGVTGGGGINTGVNNKGTIFRMTLGGTLTTLYAFGTQSTDGVTPNGRLVQGTDGNLYGVTAQGGTGGGGTIFRLSLAGALTTLYSFKTSVVFGGPAGALIQATDGNFYGTTFGGGAHGSGTVFQMTPAGSVTTIYSFGSVAGDGSFPNAGLVQGSDSNLYGTTSAGGTNGVSTLFRVSLSGTVTTLATFSGSEGTGPEFSMIQASDGNLYGTTSRNGYTKSGSVFKYFITATPPQAPTITKGGVVPVYSSVPTIQQGEWISIYGANLAGTTTVWNGDFPLSLGGTNVEINGKPAYIWFVSPTQINVQAPTDASTGAVSVTVTTAGGTATSTVTLAQIAPMFSLFDSSHVAGIILRSDGSGAYGGGTYDLLGPTGTSLGYGTVAAKAGDSVALFAVGFGPTKPAVPAGVPFSGSAPATSTVNLTVNSQTITPSYAGQTSAGLFQINLKIPAGLGAGDVPLQAIVGGIQTPTGVVISLQ